MCYICEAQGHVGQHYREGLKAIRAALRVWGHKKRGDGEQQVTIKLPGDRRHVDWPIFNRAKAEWASAPKVEKPWTPARFAKHQRIPYIAMDFGVLPRVHRL